MSVINYLTVRDTDGHYLNSDGKRICGDSSSEGNFWVCSLEEGHLDDHEAYGSHALHVSEFCSSWPQPLKELVIEEWP